MARDKEEPSLEERVRSYRRSFWSSIATLVFLFMVNLLVSPQFPWVIFAIVGIGIRLAHGAISLWSDGVRWRDLFTRGDVELPEPKPIFARNRGSLDHAPRERMIGDGGAGGGRDQSRAPHSVQSLKVRAMERSTQRAREHHDAILKILKLLTPADRAMIPDVRPTVDALLERAVAIGESLARIEDNIDPTSLAQIDARLRTLVAEKNDSPEWEKKHGLLERQRSSVADLESRREELKVNFDRVMLLLENLRLDFVKLMSSGAQTASVEGGSVTQQAQALSRNIRHAIDAAAEVRSIR